MSIKTKLLTSVAILSLGAAPVFAEQHVAATADEGTETMQTELETGAPLGWNDDLDQRYADIADRPVRDLIGMNVISDTGDDVGEVDTFVILDGELQAVVGVGGFLGLGEHNVALSLADLTWDGERLVIPFTKEELEAMPEWDEQAEFATLGDDDTFRTRVPVDGAETADTDMAATEQDTAVEGDTPTGEEVAAAEEAAGDEDTMTEEVAEAEQGEIEQEAEEIAAETEMATEQATDEVADAAEATENAVEEGAAEAEQMAEGVATETEEAAEAAGEEVAEAAEATGDAVAEGAEATEQMAENAANEASSWFAEIESVFGDLADAEIAELEGMEVVSADGEVIGEIDNIAMHNGAPVAIVGVGGFIGLGEHDVALELSRLQHNGENFVLNGYTEEDLKALPEVDLDAVEMLDDNVTLRSHASM